MKLNKTDDGGAALNEDRGFEFHELSGCKAVLYAGGSFRASKVYERGGRAYCKYGSGYVELNSHGTSHDKVRVNCLYLSPEIAFSHDKMGRLTLQAPTITIEHSPRVEEKRAA